MEEPSVNEKIKDIKRAFRLQMNGVAAQSMRDKGLDYHLNWGIALPALRDKAKEIGKNYVLSIALWKENVRECKILATLIMPPEEMSPEVVDIWMEQTLSVEIAEQASLNLYQHLPYASEKAYGWIASNNDIYQICGFHVLSRLFLRGQEPNERGINEFIDQTQTAIQGKSIIVRKAAISSVMRFSDLGLVYERIAATALLKLGLKLK